MRALQLDWLQRRRDLVAAETGEDMEARLQRRRELPAAGTPVLFTSQL